MKKIKLKIEKGTVYVDAAPYEEYLKEKRDSFPEAVRNYLDGLHDGQPDSFGVHDADLDRLKLEEVLEEVMEDADLVRTDASLVLVQPDMDIHLHYKNVLSYAMNMDNLEKPSRASSNCAVLFDELVMVEGGPGGELVRHELFWNNGSMVIVCEEFDYRVEPVERPDRSRCLSDIRMYSTMPWE